MIIGQNFGFKKEKDVVGVLDGKLFKDLHPTYQKLISSKIPTISSSEKILCKKKEGKNLEKKTDLIITASKQKINVSLKQGKNNSVHQEKIHEFIEYLSNIKLLSQAEKNYIYNFHWCDGTYDNSGLLSDRQKKDIYKKLNPNDYAIYMATLHSYKKAIFDRVLLGTKNIPDYLIHFKNKDEEIPKVFNYSNLLTEHMKPSDTQSRIGLFTVQNTNSCLSGQDLKEKPKKNRNDIQFKIQDLFKLR